jgi:hypothetical protein
MHNILLSLEILAYVKNESNFADEYTYTEIIGDWALVYRHLLKQGRIWETRDLILACMSAFDAKQAWRMILGADLHSPDFFTKFLREWKADKYDPSTYLAILDIMVGLSRFLLGPRSPDKDNIVTAKRCLEQARDLAASIKENDTEFIKSRPYIQWILVQEGLSRRLGYEEGTKSRNFAFSFEHLQNFPGFTMWTDSLPSYVPAGAENPGFSISDIPESNDELLHIALQASEELGDYRTQVMCLRELICRAKEPNQLFNKLAHLQKSVQGDMIGYLQTCITKYLYATTDESRQALIDEFADFDGRQAMSYCINDPLMLWNERKVQSALYISMGMTNEAGNAREMAGEHERGLPKGVRNAISRLHLSTTHDPEIEERIIEREIIYDGGREREGGREWDRVNKEPRYINTQETYSRNRPSRGNRGLAALATASQGALPRKKILDHSRSRSRSSEARRRRDIRRQSSLDTFDRKPLTREVEGIYDRPQTITDFEERRPRYVTAPKDNAKEEEDYYYRREVRERLPTSKEVTIRNPHDSEMSIEEVRRDFPPPGTYVPRINAAGWAPALSDTKEEVEKSDGDTHILRNLIEEPPPERKDGETEEEYKQRIKNYVSLHEEIQGRLSRVLTQARLKLDQIRRRSPTPPPPPPERLQESVIETRERMRDDSPLGRHPGTIVRRTVVREESPSPARFRERVIERTTRSISPLVRTRIIERERERSPSPVRTIQRYRVRERSPSPVRTRVIERERERSPSPVRTIQRYRVRERSPSLGNDQKAPKTNGGAGNGADTENPVNGKTEELIKDERADSVEKIGEASSEDDESVETEYSKRGKTRMPARLVDKRAIIDLGYPFSEEVSYLAPENYAC